MEEKKIKRRKVFQWGAGLMGAVVAGPQIAQACGVGTAPQPLGPFFPGEGTPQHPVREDQNGTIPGALANDNDLTFVRGRGPTSGAAKGTVVHIHGRLTDSQCQPIGGASIVIWQASASGRYNHKGDSANPSFTHPRTGEIMRRDHDENFQYWGQAETDDDGRYVFKTIVPGFYPANLQSGWYRPPHVHFLVSATGKEQYVTQMYFKSEEFPDNAWIQELNAVDFLLQNPNLSQPQKEALVVEFATATSGPEKGQLVGIFDIQL